MYSNWCVLLCLHSFLVTHRMPIRFLANQHIDVGIHGERSIVSVHLFSLTPTNKIWNTHHKSHFICCFSVFTIGFFFLLVFFSAGFFVYSFVVSYTVHKIVRIWSLCEENSSLKMKHSQWNQSKPELGFFFGVSHILLFFRTLLYTNIINFSIIFGYEK